jgi:hypothetical protein
VNGAGRPVSCGCKLPGGGDEVPPAMDTRKGLTPPVICGLKPTPTVLRVPFGAGLVLMAFVLVVDPIEENKLGPGLCPNVVEKDGSPVGCPTSDPPGEDAVEFDTLGTFKVGREVPFVDPVGAIGLGFVVDGVVGNDSSKDAPKEEVGLNGFSPAKPVACGCSGAVPTEDGFVPVEVPKERLENESERAEVEVTV